MPNLFRLGITIGVRLDESNQGLYTTNASPALGSPKKEGGKAIILGIVEQVFIRARGRKGEEGIRRGSQGTGQRPTRARAGFCPERIMGRGAGQKATVNQLTD